MCNCTNTHTPIQSNEYSFMTTVLVVECAHSCTDQPTFHYDEDDGGVDAEDDDVAVEDGVVAVVAAAGGAGVTAGGCWLLVAPALACAVA